jgi:hypothetical protein
MPKFNFRYQAPGLAMDAAQAAAGIAAGSREEQERRRKAALEAAAHALREREVGQGDTRIKLDADKFGWEQTTDTRDYGRQVVTEDRDFGETQRKNTADIADTEADNTRLSGDSAETVRHNRASEGIDRTKAAQGRPQLRQTASGFAWFYPDGRTSGVVDEKGDPVVGVPTQGERQATGNAESLDAAYKILDENFKAVGYKAPNIPTQVGMDASKQTGMGPLTSLTRALANTAVGKYAPEYQKVNNALDSFGSLLVKLMTGAQMSEPEAQRIFNIIKPVAGDQPEVVQQKLQQARNIVEASKIQRGRALRERIYAEVGEEAPAGFDDTEPGAAPASSDGSDLKKKYGLE